MSRILYENLAMADIGDSLLFRGKSRVSNIIAFGTLNPWSHSAVVSNLHEITESTSLNGFTGVVRRPLTQALEQYEGAVILLRVHDPLRSIMDYAAGMEWLDRQVGKPYDSYLTVAKAGIDWFWRSRYRNKEDLSRLFCSELDIGFKRALGIIGQINASEVTPADMWRSHLFPEDQCHRVPLNEAGLDILQSRYGWNDWPLCSDCQKDGTH